MLRRAVILGVITALPVLAVPPINQIVNAWLHDETPPQSPWEPTVPTRQAPSPPQQIGPAELPFAGDQYAIQQMEEELRGLGAENVAFDFDPHDRGGYQCRCRVALPGNSVYRRPFVAWGPTPRAAVAGLLDAVRRWQENAAPGQDLGWPDTTENARSPTGARDESQY